jgi:hypothetical protein
VTVGEDPSCRRPPACGRELFSSCSGSIGIALEAHTCVAGWEFDRKAATECGTRIRPRGKLDFDPPAGNGNHSGLPLSYYQSNRSRRNGALLGITTPEGLLLFIWRREVLARTRGWLRCRNQPDTLPTAN